jgi:hypothetical protein
VHVFDSTSFATHIVCLSQSVSMGGACGLILQEHLCKRDSPSRTRLGYTDRAVQRLCVSASCVGYVTISKEADEIAAPCQPGELEQEGHNISGACQRALETGNEYSIVRRS